MGFWQYAVSPRRQVSQVPSSPPKNPTPTRWPTCQVVTPRQTSTMRPIASWPGTRGYTTPGSCPSTVPASERHTPQASTRIRTCSSPGPTTGFSTRRKVPGLVISTALYVFPIFVSYRSGRTRVSSFTRIADKRQVETSPLLAILAQLRLSHYFGSFDPCLDRKCRSLAFLLGFSGGKRECRPLLLFRRGELERLRHRCVCSSPPSWRSSNNLTEAPIESWLVSESDFQRDC